MKLKNVAFVAFVFMSTGAVADSYKAELSAQASRVDFDNSNNKVNTYGGAGTFYFDAVETVNVPLAEAAYLGKNSNVYAGADHTSWKDDNTLVLDIDMYTVGIEFFIPENFLYVSAGATKSNYKNGSDSDWYTSIGITPIEGLLIATSYSKDEGYDPNIRAKYVLAMGNGQFINLEAAFEDTDEGNSAIIGGDFYFDNSLSVGGSIGRLDSNNTYQLRTRKFFTEKFSGNISYSSYESYQSVSVGINFRF
jgi:hypothetical protein